MRSVEIRKVPRERRLVIDALRVGQRQIPVHGLIDVDITIAQQRLGAFDPPLSMTAFVAACVGRAAARHPEVHGYRDWRGRLVLHSHVDIATLIEVETPTGTFPLAHLIVDADSRSIADISKEIRSVQNKTTASPARGMVSRGIPVIAATPGLIRLGYHLANRSVRLRRHTGTVSLTAIGMFGSGGGFGVAAPTLSSLGIVVGGISSQPRVLDDQVAIRNIMNLTITVDHRIVDGAPAARFAADLREGLETAELLGARHGQKGNDTTSP